MTAYSAQAFRRSTFQFAAGRIINALIGFTAFVAIARFLPEREYANYVAAFACLELGLVIFGFGMEWVTSIFVPHVRLKAGGASLERFVWKCAGLQGILLLTGATVYWYIASYLSEWLGLANSRHIFQLYAVVLLVEGSGRVLRDQLLSCLLLQGKAQIAQLTRNMALLLFVVILVFEDTMRTASALATAEIVASSISLCFSLFVLMRFLRNNRHTQAQDSRWEPPTISTILPSAVNAWISNISGLIWSGQAIVLLVTRLAGSEFTAVLGFARNLSEQVKRYLPVEFLLGILRTLLVSRYVQEGDPQKLATRASLLYRANLLFLLPILVLVVTHGDQICALLSNGRYITAQWILVGWLSVLVFWAHHRITDVLAHIHGRSDLSRRASLYLLLTPIALAIAVNYQNWILMFSLLAVAELLYSFLVLFPLRAYTLNWPAVGKIFIASAMSALTLMLPIWQISTYSLLAQLITSFSVTFGMTYLLKAWPEDELTLILGSRLSV